MRKPKTPNALTVLPSPGQQLAAFESLTAKAAGLATKARSPRTLEEYQRCWRKFESWCETIGAPSMPTAIPTVCMYVGWLQDEAQNYAISSIGQATAAIKFAHELKRVRPWYEHSQRLDDNGEPADWSDPRLTEIMKGIRNVISERRQVKRAKALTDQDIRDILELVQPGMPREVRDAALIAMLYSGCKRRSEICGLDYLERCPNPKQRGTGTLEIADDGVVITLIKSKTNQAGEPERFLINNDHFPRACVAIADWIALAKIQPGTPVFREIVGTSTNPLRPRGAHVGVRQRKDTGKWMAVHKGKYLSQYATEAEAIAAYEAVATPTDTILARRLGGGNRQRMFPNIIQKRMFQVLCKRSLADSRRKRLKPEELEQLWEHARKYSGHSPRSGSITSAFNRQVPRHDVRKMSGHKPGSAMLDHYAQGAEGRDNKFGVGSGL